MRKWIRTNQAVGVMLTAGLACLLLYIQLMPWSHIKLRDGFYLGFFPALGVGLMMIFSILLIVDSRRKEVPANLKEARVSDFLLAFAEAVLCWLYFAVMLKISYLLMTPVFLFAGMYLMGLKPWKNVLLIAVFITILTYFLFYLMGIELPSGILPRILHL